VDDAGAGMTSGPSAITRKDRFRRPAREDPPALFLTNRAATSLNWGESVKVSVAYRAKEIVIPNAVGRIGAESGECVLLSCNAGGIGHATAVVLAATKMLSNMPEPTRRPIVVAIAAKPELEPGGLDWLIAHLPVPVSKILAAVHVDGTDLHGGEQIPGFAEILPATRACVELRTAALDALGQNGFPGHTATACPEAQRFVDAYLNRGIPAIGLQVTPGTFDEGIAAARAVAALTRALAARESRPVLPASQ
jgi:hypothetical protein